MRENTLNYIKNITHTTLKTIMKVLFRNMLYPHHY